MKSLATPPIAMPNYHFLYVSHLRAETKMSIMEATKFEYNIRHEAQQFLDSSGRVEIEDQDPVALKCFLDSINTLHPTINRRYAYAWPILAYLDVYFYNRRRSRRYRYPEDETTTAQVTRRGRCAVPVWIRYAHSLKTGESLELVSTGLCSHKFGHGRRFKSHRERRVTAAENSYKDVSMSSEDGSHEIAQPDVRGVSTSGELLTSLWPSFETFLSNLATWVKN